MMFDLLKLIAVVFTLVTFSNCGLSAIESEPEIVPFRKRYTNPFYNFSFPENGVDLTIPNDDIGDFSRLKLGEEYNDQPECTVPAGPDTCVFCKINATDDAMLIGRPKNILGKECIVLMASARPLEADQIVVFPTAHGATTSALEESTWETMTEYVRIMGYLLQNAPFNHATIEIGSNCGPSDHSGASQPAHAHWQVIPYSNSQKAKDYHRSIEIGKNIKSHQIEFSKAMKSRLEYFMKNEYEPKKKSSSLFARLSRFFILPSNHIQLIYSNPSFDKDNLIIRRNDDHTIVWALDPQTSAHLQIISNDQCTNPLDINNEQTKRVWYNMCSTARLLQYLLRVKFCAKATNVVTRIESTTGTTTPLVIDIIGKYGSNNQGFPNFGCKARNMIVSNPPRLCERMKLALQEYNTPSRL